jgi:hypothetical protein
MKAANTAKHAASAPFRATDYLQADDLPGYLADVLADGALSHCRLPCAMPPTCWAWTNSRAAPA